MNNAIEQLNREIRRHARVVGTFPDGKLALMLVAARLKYVADSEWDFHRSLDTSLFKEQPCQRLAENSQRYRRHRVLDDGDFLPSAGAIRLLLFLAPTIAA